VPTSLRVRHTSLTDSVASTLRRMILNREFEPGERITQVQLAALLGVSTMPIREALLRLVAEGLVIAEANRSFRITETSESEIRDIYWMHAVLAAELTGRAWERRTADLLATLHTAHDAYRENLTIGNQTVGNHEDLFQSNWAFHSALHNAAGAPALGLMLKNTLRFFPDFSVPVDGWPELAAQWQAGLIREFTDGSRAGAEEVARSSIGTASDLFIASFWSDGGADTAGTGSSEGPE
jgi:DNA-binding GntR family transcriptional regulator